MPASSPPTIPKVEQRTGAAAEIFIRQRVIGIVGKARVIDPLDLRMLPQIFGDPACVLDVAFDPQRDRFDTLQQQEGAESGDSTAPVVR